MLKHPRKCPHDHEIPRGKCCKNWFWYKLYHGCIEQNNMTCFCGCESYVKDSNGFKIGCVKCSHGPQNHEESFKIKPNTEGNQKRGSLN
jgi:hypothetical protein